MRANGVLTGVGRWQKNPMPLGPGELARGGNVRANGVLMGVARWQKNPTPLVQRAWRLTMMQQDDDSTSMIGNVQDLVIGAVVLMLGYCAWRFFNSPVAQALGKTVNGAANVLQWSLSSPWAFLLTLIVGLVSAVAIRFGLIKLRVWEKKVASPSTATPTDEKGAKDEKNPAPPEEEADEQKEGEEDREPKETSVLHKPSSQTTEAAKKLQKFTDLDALFKKNRIDAKKVYAAYEEHVRLAHSGGASSLKTMTVVSDSSNASSGGAKAEWKEVQEIIGKNKKVRWAQFCSEMFKNEIQAVEENVNYNEAQGTTMNTLERVRVGVMKTMPDDGKTVMRHLAYAASAGMLKGSNLKGVSLGAKFGTLGEPRGRAAALVTKFTVETTSKTASISEEGGLKAEPEATPRKESIPVVPVEERE